MYIAIEGIKGTGKSTVLKELFKQIEHPVEYFPFTSRIYAYHPLEALCLKSPQLKENDFFCEQLFAERARWRQSLLQKKGTVLGDRSILTAYVTRWNKWKDPYYTIRRSNKLHQQIMHPDVVIWMRCYPEISVKRIQARQQKDLGKSDEKLEKLAEADACYEELITGKLYKKSVKKIQSIIIPANVSCSEITTELKSILNFYNN